MNPRPDPTRATARFISVGCGGLAGAVLGVFVAVRVTFMWVRPGEWYEWPVVGIVVLICAALVAWMVGRGWRSARS